MSMTMNDSPTEPRSIDALTNIRNVFMKMLNEVKCVTAADPGFSRGSLAPPLDPPMTMILSI